MAEFERRMAGSRYLLIRLALWLGACVVAFAVAEVAFRTYAPFKLVVTGNRIVLPVNREYTFETGPGLRLSTWAAGKLDPVITHTKNSLGFRGTEPPASRDEYLTIVTVGGSTTECFYLSDGKTWPDRLEGALSEALSPVWVGNAGLDGHSTVGHTVLLEDYIVPLKPTVVLFLIGINDLYVEQAAAFDRGVQRSGLDFSSPKQLLVSAANYSRALAVPLNLYRDARAESLGIGHDVSDFTALPTRVVSAGDRVRALERFSRGLPAFEERLSKLIALSRAAGIEPVFVTQPVLYGRGVDDVTGVNLELIPVGEINGAVAWEALETYNDVTRTVGRRKGVHVIDLAATLAKSSRHYYDFFHYSNEGAVAVADIVHDSLCPFLAERYPQYLRGSCAARPGSHDEVPQEDDKAAGRVHDVAPRRPS